MSVEITGPKGYEWQYRITLLIALLNPDCDSLVIESIAGEDAQLRYSDDTETHLVEIQAKSSKADIKLAVLCHWICHFPNNDTSDSLLSKLAGGRIRILFVAGGRCADWTRPYVREMGNLTPHASISNEICDAVLRTLTEYTTAATKDKPLTKLRKESLRSVAEKFDNNRALLKQALCRILIWESTSLNTMNRELIALLTKNHRVPQLQCMPLVLHLENAIRAARDHRADVSKELSSIIHQHSSLALLGDESHHLLGHESSLLISSSKQERTFTNWSPSVRKNKSGKVPSSKDAG